MGTDKIINGFLKSLNEEYLYLVKTRGFLKDLENKMVHEDLLTIDFCNIIQEFEMKAEYYLKLKEEMIFKVAGALNIESGRVSFKLLINLGYTDFRVLSGNINKMSLEVRQLLLKLSVLLRTFVRYNENEKRINKYVSQRNYSVKPVAADKESFINGYTWEV
jgi:hypothetical protein